jgi:hypothetical protein
MLTVACSRICSLRVQETTSVAWGWLLDVLRYLIVFNPIFIAIAQGALYVVY